MKRRTLLASAAALLPTAALEALAQVPALMPAEAGSAHIVKNGEDRDGESHSRGFSSILFKVSSRETGGGLFVIEHENLVKGGPPLHLHIAQEEWFYVVEGRVVFQVGDRRVELGAGDSILGPRNVPHAFSAVGSSPGRMLIAFTPAGQMEDFFRATAIPHPPMQDAAFFRRYGMELLGPSPWAG